MTAPLLNLVVEPVVSGRLVYLPMAPASSKPGKPARGRVFLQVRVTNNGTAPVTVSDMTVSFPSSGVTGGKRTITQLTPAPDPKAPPPIKPVGRLAPGESINLSIQKASGHYVFNLPAPPRIQIAVSCIAFSEPSVVSFDLAAHAPAVSGGAYLFPCAAGDLGLGEFWQMGGASHDPATDGSQAFAYDMSVVGIDHETGLYSFFVKRSDGTLGDGKRNSDYRVFGKPVRAMADGTVVEFVNDCPDNPAPIQADDPLFQSKMDNQRDTLWNAKTNGVAGNHFAIQHGNELMIYAHMQKNSLNTNFMTVGQFVPAGTILGKAGNSGNSTGPHTHIHAVRDTVAYSTGPAMPIVLRNSHAIDMDLVVTQQSEGFWSKLNPSGIPQANCLLHPSGSLPPWPEEVRISVHEEDYQTVFDQMRARGLDPVAFTAETFDKLFFHGTLIHAVFRPGGNQDRIFRHAMSHAEFQSDFDKFVKHGPYRMEHLESYFSRSRNMICYAATFLNPPSGVLLPRPGQVYHGVSEAQHDQALLNARSTGLVPVNVSVVSLNGQRTFSAFYEHGSGTSIDAPHSMTMAQFNDRFQTNLKKGFRLTHMKAYNHNGTFMIAGIWGLNAKAASVQLAINEDGFASLLKTERKLNRALRILTASQDGLDLRFVGLWN
jgi:murein DD-endopeptidase MepM/ murein hydrolase activator NlpD